MTSQAPILIGSAPSSGSTMLVNLIGRARGIYQTHELSIFDKPGWLGMGAAELAGNWPGMHSRGYPRRLACEMRAVFTGCDEFPVPAAGEGYLDFTFRYMDELASSHGCTRWVEKTPGNIFSIGRLSQMRPDARFVVIVRDARSVTASLVKRGYSPVIAAARWYLGNLHAHALGRNPGVFVLKYEDLVDRPLDTCRGLFKFIQAEFDEALLDAREDSKPIATWTASPSSGISKSGLWPEQRAVAPAVAAALAAIRVEPAYAAAQGLGSSLPTAPELQHALGYPTGGLDPGRGGAGLRERFALAGDAVRYRASMLRHGLKPLPLPFNIRGRRSV